MAGALGAQAFGPGVVLAATIGAALAGRLRGAPGRAGLALGCAIPASLGALPPPEPPTWRAEGPVWIRAEVLRRPRIDPDGSLRMRVVLRPSGAEATLRVRAGGGPGTPQPGDRLTGPVHASPGRVAPRLDGDLRALAWQPSRGWRARTGRLRARLADELLARIPGTPGLVVCHLVLGDGPALPLAIRDAHRATGLAHLLAVSGAHATLLAGMLAWGAGVLRGRSARGSTRFRRFTTLFLLFYSLLTGLDPPVLRALIAWSLWSSAQARGRRVPAGSLLAAPALLTAAIAPQDLRQPGFWLSYAAVLGLWAAAPFGQGGVVGPLRAAARASAWAWWTTMPIALAWFGATSAWTIVGTPLCASLVAMMLGLGVVVAGSALWAPGLADLISWVLAPPAELYVLLVESLDHLPGTPTIAPCTPHTAALWACGLGAGALFAARPCRRTLAAAALLGSLPSLIPLGPPNGERFDLLPVGHGQAALFVDSNDHRVLVDCGSLMDGSRASRRVLDGLPPGPRRIDLLVLTHEDGDHWNGVPDLLQSVHIARAWIAEGARDLAVVEALRAHGAELTFVRAGERLETFEHFVVVAPDVEQGASANDRSLWLRYDGSFSALLPADAETDAIRRMLGDEIVRGTDVLVLPHHGRGSSEDFAALRIATAPRRVFISRAGEREQRMDAR